MRRKIYPKESKSLVAILFVVEILCDETRIITNAAAAFFSELQITPIRTEYSQFYEVTSYTRLEWFMQSTNSISVSEYSFFISMKKVPTRNK